MYMKTIKEMAVSLRARKAKIVGASSASSLRGPLCIPIGLTGVCFGAAVLVSVSAAGANAQPAAAFVKSGAGSSDCSQPATTERAAARGNNRISKAPPPGARRQSNDCGPPGSFSFTAGGDLIGPYLPFSGDGGSGLSQVADLFLRADLGFANQEGAVFDLRDFRGYRSAETGGAAPLYAKKVAKNLRAMGITIVSKANNHATDWGTLGLEATLGNLSSAGIVQAGSGLSLAEARAPGYVNTPHGRAALVDVASTFPPNSVAGDRAEDQRSAKGLKSQPRPGISALHVRLVRLLSADSFRALKASAGAAAYPTKGREDELRIGDTVFRVSSAPGTTWEMQASDENEVLASVREARRNAGFVLFSIHAHETAGDEDPGPQPFQPVGLHFAAEAAAPTDPTPADFEPRLFHAAIDAGADAVVRNGPHVIGGIEIYRGKPIFYSLGNLFFPFGNRRLFTDLGGETRNFADDHYESIVVVAAFKNGKVREIKIYPIEIETNPGPALGFPHKATQAKAHEILDRVKARSAPYNTVVSIEGDVGVIRVTEN